MKKAVSICISIIAIIVAFILGVVVGNGNHSKNDVVGVYQTDSWNGKVGTLVLYEDGTCQYPSGGKATWEKYENTIQITIESSYSIQDGSTKGITIYINNDFSDEKINGLLNSIEKINNVESISWNEETNTCQILLAVAESDNKTTDEISKIEGIKIIERILDKGVSKSEHEAKIMENGLVLHGQFFEKVSN